MEYVINSEEINEFVDNETKFYRRSNMCFACLTLILTGVIIFMLLSSPNRTQGLWLKHYNQTGVDEITKQKESYGDWICINIDGMNFTEMQRVIQHEMAHEIFSEHCENNVSKCFEQIR